jgi:hypothetical protein
MERAMSSMGTTLCSENPAKRRLTRGRLAHIFAGPLLLRNKYMRKSGPDRSDALGETEYQNLIAFYTVPRIRLKVLRGMRVH